MTSKAFGAMMFASLLAVTPAFAHRPPEIDEPGGATILCYHIVESPQDPRMEISRNVFQQQMRYLSTTGYTVVLSTYTEEELVTILAKADELFATWQLGKPTAFRAGGWAAEPNVLKALQRGFKLS